MGELALGVVAGVAVGLIGAVGIIASTTRGLALPGGRRLAALATALAAYGLAVSIAGNGGTPCVRRGSDAAGGRSSSVAGSVRVDPVTGGASTL